MLTIHEEKSIALNGKTVVNAVEISDALLMGGQLLYAHGKHLSVMDVSKEGVQPWQVECKKRVAILSKLDEDTALFVDSAGSVRALHMVTRTTRDLFAHFSPVTAIAVVNDRFIVTADVDMQVRVSRLDLPSEIVFFLLGHESPVVSFVVSTRATERHILGSVSTLGVVLWHSLENGQQMQHPFARIQSNLYQRKN